LDRRRVHVVHGARAGEARSHHLDVLVAALDHAGVAVEVEVLGEDLLGPAVPQLLVDELGVETLQLLDLLDVLQPLHVGLQLRHLVVSHRIPFVRTVAGHQGARYSPQMQGRALTSRGNQYGIGGTAWPTPCRSCSTSRRSSGSRRRTFAPWTP